MSVRVKASTDQRRAIMNLLDRHIPGIEVWAYGSRIRWTSRPTSDLDIVVFAKGGERRLVADLKEALEESNLPFLVDVHIWDDLPAAFHRNIEREHVVLRTSSNRT